MRRFFIIFAVVIGIGMCFGIDGYSMWSGLLLLILVITGFTYMFTGKFMPQFIESFLILLFTPLLVVYIIKLAGNFLTRLFSGYNFYVNPGFLIILVVVVV